MNSGPSPRPMWHRWVYTLVAAIFAAFLYFILSGLTDRILAAEQAASEARVAANEARDGAALLAEQVEGLGATPVVDPDDLPEPAPPGEDGQDGADGTSGAPGTAGTAGSDGATGPRGLSCIEQLGLQPCIGPPGSDGTDGRPGADGTDGSDGVNGADSTVAGPVGPEGPPGPAGPAGQDGTDSNTPGPQGPQGPQGPAGPTCPDGYEPRERTVVSNENPFGEPAIVCVRQEPAT